MTIYATTTSGLINIKYNTKVE